MPYIQKKPEISGESFMKNDKLTIGQMAKLNHVSPSTLRFYEKMGLLEPDYTDPETGYRYYDVTQSVVIRAIQYNTNLEISVKELQDIVNANNYALVGNLYKKKLQEVEDALQQLSQKKHALYKTMMWLDHYRHLPPAGTFTLEFLRSEYVYTLPAQKNYFQADFRTYVRSILDMTEKLDQDHIAFRYQYFTSFTMKQESYLTGNFQAAEVGVYVDAAYADYPHVKKEQGQLCACTYVQDFKHLPVALQALKNFCGEHGCTVIGDVVCRLLGTLSLADFRTPCPFLRLQVPVQMVQRTLYFQTGENRKNVPTAE